MVVKRKYDRDELLSRARELVGTYGESLTLMVFTRETGISQRVIYELFGSWRALRVEVGLKADAPRNSNEVTREEILAKMKVLAKEHGERLTFRLFLNETGYSGQLIEIRFGSWGALRKEAGLKRPRAPIEPRYSHEDILLDLYRVYRIFRERPKYDMHKYRGGRISPGTICHRLGSWDWACRRLADYLRDHDHFNPSMELPAELEAKIRALREAEEWD